MAEAHAMANQQIGWMGVVVGDPKMAPYADQFHDIRLIDVRNVANVTQGLNATLELVVENHGMSMADGRLEVRDVQGSTLLSSINITMPAGNLSGSRIVLPLNVTVERSGWIDVQIRYLAADAHGEVAVGDNLLLHRFWSNAPPVVLDARCLGQAAYRGDNIICEVEASDDLNVTTVRLEWSVRNDTTNVTSAWEELPLGTSDGLVWWSSLFIPVDAALVPTGMLDLRAVAVDASQATTTLDVQGVLKVLNAPSSWYGPHVTDVDDSPWAGVTLPPGVPFKGLPRDATSTVSACVSDVDHDPVGEAPTLSVQRKNGPAVESVIIDSLGEINLNPSLTCSAWNLTLPNGLPLDDLDLVIHAAEEERVRRRFAVDDQAPLVALSLLNEDGSALDRAVGDGSERLHITYSDLDDAGTGAVGDLIVSWPGQAPRVMPLQINAGTPHIIIEVEAPINPLEDGVLVLEVDLVGAHGATAAASLERDLALAPPTIAQAVLCDERGQADELRFGMEIWFGASVISSRPLQETVVTIEQEGWRSTAPRWTPGESEASPSPSCAAEVPDDEHAQWFRLRPDRAFVNGEASVGLRATDIDGASSRSVLNLILRHAPPEIGLVTVNSTGVAGDPVTLTADLTDLDGVLGVECTLTVVDQEGGVVHEGTARVVAFTEEEAELSATWLSLGTVNGTLTQTLRCVDVDDEFDVAEVPVALVAANRSTDPDDGGVAPEAESDGLPLFLLAVPLLLLVTVVTVLFARSKAGVLGEEGGVELEKANQDQLWDHAPASEAAMLKRPEGWSVEQYGDWLNGPCPEGWSNDAWDAFVEEQTPLNQ
jgi:hypothetical protein